MPLDAQTVLRYELRMVRRARFRWRGHVLILILTRGQPLPKHYWKLNRDGDARARTRWGLHRRLRRLVRANQEKLGLL